MSKKKSMNPQDDEYFNNVFNEDFEENEEMINTFGQVADASVEHMKVACKLTKIIVTSQANEKFSTDDILEIFRKASETILDCTPLKALFEEKQ